MMTSTTRKYYARMSALAVLATTLALPLSAGMALAQDAATPDAATPPAKQAPAVPKTAAKKVEAKKAATNKKADAVKKAKPASACKGLAQDACGTNKACAWITPKDANDKTGKVQKPYCRMVAGVAKKADAKKKDLKKAATKKSEPSSQPAKATP